MSAPDGGSEPHAPDTTASQTQWATLDSVKDINKKVDLLARDVTGMKITVEGHIVGAQRVPGLVDIVGNAVSDTKQIKWILAAVGVPVIIAVVLQVLSYLGIIHAAGGHP